ncbi:MAG: 2Fe-2S iron-sulfur cluster-binding protein [Myxococcota bacterium]|nr:2Fe-2S iron-sulfur cluster-binding protein [Myxococcota bacterium]
MSGFKVSFPGTEYGPMVVSEGPSLSEELDAANSPLLFGCRTGICGTCVVEVDGESLPPPDEDEREILEVYAPDNPKARLACQLRVTSDITIRPFEE